ncbi:unnamed protein product [Parnassius apollo]|uniref:(apollo) hypothetical protein n=1 Tax=Parnassius apollo TaxID=110799 RepID=A0A8S3WDW0_PARAO|nr:unnamed protein product [Parnassius apollo]
MRSKIFDNAELERLRREAIPSSNESAMAGVAAPHATDQHPHVEAAMDLPVVVDSNDDEIVSHELEQMRSRFWKHAASLSKIDRDFPAYP